MQLPVPIFKDKIIVDRVEFDKPRAGVLADTLKVYNEQGEFQAILEFLAKSITTMFTVDDQRIDNKERIRALCRRMPYRSGEVIAIEIMALINKDDWVEGLYVCPRCGKKIITGVQNGYDNRDKIKDLKIIRQGEKKDDEAYDIERYDNVIHVDLEDDIKITQLDTGAVIHEVVSLDFRYSTLEDCIKGSIRFPSDDSKKSFAILVESMVKKNDEEAKVKWKKMWGDMIIAKLSYEDLSQINMKLKKYGMRRTLEKTCRNCGKVWDAAINTSNFFVSGLRSV